MSDYITRGQAMEYITFVINELSLLRLPTNQRISEIPNISSINDFELRKGVKDGIKAKIGKLLGVYRKRTYHESVKSLSTEEFVQYYGKICQLAETLKLNALKEIQEKLKLKALDQDKERYYYYEYHQYAGNSPITYDRKLTESGEQMEVLVAAESTKSGAEAATQRKKISDMNREKLSEMLEELFEMDEDFMNIKLRDFLNLKEDGTMDYDIDVLKKTKEWKESSGFGARYHQTNTDGEMYFPKKTVIHKGVPIDVVGERLLNAKFTCDDGREVVFNPKRKVVTDKLDKGTYNYMTVEVSLLGHKKFDVDPYERLMEYGNEEAGIKPADIILRYNTVKLNARHGNTHFWPKEKK